MHLHGQDDRVGRGNKGVLADGVEDLSDGDLAGQGATVVDDGLRVAIPAIDCKHQEGWSERPFAGDTRWRLTLNTPTSLEQGPDVPLRRAVTDKLMANEVGVVGA